MKGSKRGAYFSIPSTADNVAYDLTYRHADTQTDKQTTRQRASSMARRRRGIE